MSFNLFKHLMPAEEAFTPLFCEQAQCIVQAAAELRQMIGEDHPGPQRVASIRKIELAADAVARRIFIGANPHIQRPIDRGHPGPRPRLANFVDLSRILGNPAV
jgi:hypothetical protein